MFYEQSGGGLFAVAFALLATWLTTERQQQVFDSARGEISVGVESWHYERETRGIERRRRGVLVQRHHEDCRRPESTRSALRAGISEALGSTDSISVSHRCWMRKVETPRIDRKAGTWPNSPSVGAPLGLASRPLTRRIRTDGTRRSFRYLNSARLRFQSSRNTTHVVLTGKRELVILNDGQTTAISRCIKLPLGR